MTEATEAPEKYDFSTDPHGFTEKDITGEDILLDLLLILQNGQEDDGEGQMNLTVAIDGVVISGIAISEQEWRRRMTASLATASQLLAGGFEEFASGRAAGRAEIIKARAAEQRPIPAHRYVHMRDAHVISGNTSQEFPLWRGKLSKLSGWSLGSVNNPEASRGE